jgi:hypothetical protein
MPVEWRRTAALVDIIERVVDKGVVLHAFVKDGYSGLDTTDARVSVEPIETARDATPSPLPVFGSGASSKSAVFVEDDDDD